MPPVIYSLFPHFPLPLSLLQSSSDSMRQTLIFPLSAIMINANGVTLFALYLLGRLLSSGVTLPQAGSAADKIPRQSVFTLFICFFLWRMCR